MAEELRAMLGVDARKLELAGAEIELRPLRLKQFGQLLGVLPPAIAGLFGTFEGFAAWAKDQNLLNDKNELIISGRSLTPIVQELLLRAAQLPGIFDKFIETMAIAAGIDKKRVEDLDMADSVRLAGVLWEMNADFFVQSVWPQVAKSFSSPTNGKSSTPSKNGLGPAQAGRESFNA